MKNPAWNTKKTNRERRNIAFTKFYFDEKVVKIVNTGDWTSIHTRILTRTLPRTLTAQCIVTQQRDRYMLCQNFLYKITYMIINVVIIYTIQILQHCQQNKKIKHQNLMSASNFSLSSIMSCSHFSLKSENPGRWTRRLDSNTQNTLTGK